MTAQEVIAGHLRQILAPKSTISPEVAAGKIIEALEEQDFLILSTKDMIELIEATKRHTDRIRKIAQEQIKNP